MSGRSELWWNKDVSRLKEQRRRPISSCPVCIQRYVTSHYETEKKLSSFLRNLPFSPKPSNDGLQLWVDWSSVENSSFYFKKSWHQDFTGKIPAGQLESYEKLMRLMGKKKNTAKNDIPWWPILLLLYVRRFDVVLQGFHTLTAFIMGRCSPDSNLSKCLLLLLLLLSRSLSTSALSIHPQRFTPIFAKEARTKKQNNISLWKFPLPVCQCNRTPGSVQRLSWIILTILLSNIKKRSRPQCHNPEGRCVILICMKRLCVTHKQNQLRCSQRWGVIAVFRGWIQQLTHKPDAWNTTAFLFPPRLSPPPSVCRNKNNKKSVWQ